MTPERLEEDEARHRLVDRLQNAIFRHYLAREKFERGDATVTVEALVDLRRAVDDAEEALEAHDLACRLPE